MAQQTNSQPVDMLAVMGTDHFNVRDMREQLGIERGWMFRYAAIARATDKGSIHRRRQIDNALRCRRNAAALRAALSQGWQP